MTITSSIGSKTSLPSAERLTRATRLARLTRAGFPGRPTRADLLTRPAKMPRPNWLAGYTDYNV